MKNDVRIMDVTTTLQGERVDMSIDNSAFAHIMNVLTDLYSNPTLAVIREYSTNAFDAHVDAGVTRPIEITLPTALSPFFKVRDYGEGLDAEDIRNIYSRYGTSTKRDSDDVVGMLGLGCKSALTYTDQFTLSSVKDGVCTQVSVSRDENGAGVMTIVAEYETDEESGTEVIVPVKSNNSFKETAGEFFQYWDEGTVLLNGVAPTRITGLKLADDILLIDRENNQYASDYVVMGNVAYPAEITSRYNDRYYAVAYAPIGSVNFTPSREALQMTKKTTEYLAALKERIASLKAAKAQSMVDEATSKPEALATALQVYALLQVKDDLTYKGEELPKSFQTNAAFEERRDWQGNVTREALPKPKDVDTDRIVVAEFEKGYRRQGWNATHALAINVVNSSHFLVGYDGRDFTKTKRAKLDMWTAKKWEGVPRGARPDQFVLVNTLQHAEWIDPSKVSKWEDIAALKLPREPKNGVTKKGRVSGSYEGYVAGDYKASLLAEDIDTSKMLFYYTTQDMGEDRLAIMKMYPSATVVGMTVNRVEKFKRDFPKAKHCSTILRKKALLWKERLSADDLLWIKSLHDYDLRAAREMAKNLDPQRIADPEVKAALRILRADHNPMLPTNHKRYGRFFARYAFDLSTATPFDNPTEKYHLLNAVQYYGNLKGDAVKHLYLYMNAVYAAENAA